MRTFGMRMRLRFGVFGMAAMMLLAGCRREVPLLTGSSVAGHSVEGRPIEVLTLGKGEDVTLVLATIHGNENAGTPLVQDLADLLQRRPELLAGRKVVLVPAVNPDGYLRNIRGNARGIDLNRNFAASNRENNARYGVTELSEPESKTIVSLLEQHKPDRIVTIHQPLKVVDWDGPGEALARHMGRYVTLPVNRLGSRPGSLGSFAGEDRKIPIITYELPKEATGRPAEELWQAYGPALVAAVTFPEAITTDVVHPPQGAAAALAIMVAILILTGIAVLMIREGRRAVHGKPAP